MTLLSASVPDAGMCRRCGTLKTARLSLLNKKRLSQGTMAETLGGCARSKTPSQARRGPASDYKTEFQKQIFPTSRAFEFLAAKRFGPQ
jgi:hypothetical protein